MVGVSDVDDGDNLALLPLPRRYFVTENQRVRFVRVTQRGSPSSGPGANWCPWYTRRCTNLPNVVKW